MPKIIALLVLAFLPYLAVAQSDRKIDSQGNLMYQYSRSSVTNPQNNRERVVTFLFVNGNAPRAISFRQETAQGTVRWLETANGEIGTETIVDFVTANLQPKQSITWKYLYSPSDAKGEGGLERAAILLMDETFATEKIILP